MHQTIQSFNNNVSRNISMFGGLSGVNFVIWNSSDNGKNYIKLFSVSIVKTSFNLVLRDYIACHFKPSKNEFKKCLAD
jgi:hypothetical protein